MNRAISFQDVTASANRCGKKLYEYCKEKNQNITLRSYFPVDVKLAVKLLDWQIQEVDGTGYTPDDECTHGTCDRTTHTISVDLKLSDPIKRFTIAHELGHALLHEDTMSLRIAPSRRRVTVNLEKKLIEKQADLFSATLLMPQWGVTRFLRECLGSETLLPNSSIGLDIYDNASSRWDRANALAVYSFEVDDNPNFSLTSFFGVSKTAMARRLVDLYCVS